jgi:hypothetical protein
MTDPTLPPANWYPDPNTPGQQRYWDGTRWTEHFAPGAASALSDVAAPEEAPTSDTAPVKKKTALWVTLGVVGGVLLLVIIIGSIGAANRGQDVSAAEPTASASAVESEEATPTPAPEPEPTPEPAPEPDPPAVPTQEIPGSGDNVIPVSITGPAVVSFWCGDCGSNTVLKTDGRESLLVNTIGVYSGSHLVNTSDGSAITMLTVEAEGNWTIGIRDLTTIAPTNGAATGHGDSVVFMADTFRAAAITNVGESNFVIKGFGGSFAELAVNTIGSYQGTVELTGPAFIQVESEGDWSITPQ